MCETSILRSFDKRARAFICLPASLQMVATWEMNISCLSTGIPGSVHESNGFNSVLLVIAAGALVFCLSKLMNNMYRDCSDKVW